MSPRSSARDTLARMRAAATNTRPPAGEQTGAVATARITEDEPAVEVAERPPRAISKSRRRQSSTIRYTVDLTPAQRRFLHMWAFDAGVDRSVVIRAFIKVLEHDPAIADRVLDQIRADEEQGD